LGLVTVVALLPFGFSGDQSKAAAKQGLFTPTQSADPNLPNYDIRKVKGEEASSYILSARNSIGKNAVAVADVRDGFVRGEEALKARVPDVKFEYNEDIRIPEVITPDVWKDKMSRLTQPSEENRSDILRRFVKENNDLLGVTDPQADNLTVSFDYTNPDGYLSFAGLEQTINGVPVFRGEVKAGFTKDGRMIRVINNLAPGLDYGSLSTDFGDPASALSFAAQYVNNKELQGTNLKPNAALSSENKAVFGEGDFADTAEKIYFPTEPGVAVPAWRVLVWGPVSSFYVIVDAHKGTMLWRKNLTQDQTQSATYNVYANANSFIGAADNPFPLSPGPLNPTLGTQGAAITRTQITRVGNEAPYAFNNLGWITDGNNTTDGNNVQAGLDRKLPNSGNPANPNDLDPDGMATGNPTRTFDFPINPGNPNNSTGDAPIPGGSPSTCLAQSDATLPTDYQKAAVTNLFFIVNKYHDELYRLGFTEAARNFQNDNFGRGGSASDRVSAQAQDCSGSDNANFTTPADGTRPTMQMYLWTGPTPDFDGDLDAEVIIHEHTHGVSNRLHGNASGLSSNMSGGMGEGWGDFYGYSMLSEPTDPINGVYTTGGYVTYQITGGFTGNYYYGIRRFPRAPITFVGANGKPYNPFTFKYVNSDCNTNIGTTSSGPNSAFPRGPVGSSTCDQVHNLGEIWSTALWEVRNRMVSRLGWATGTQRVLQVVTDGMKLAPLNPTFLQERDAIIAAATALPLVPEASADVNDIREGFRVRGMGFSAIVLNSGSGSNNTSVTEAFDVPNVIFGSPITVSDSVGDNDGFPEPGENITVSVPVINNTGTGSVSGVSVTVTGGGTVSYGAIPDGQTVTKQIPYTVPADAGCGNQITLNITGSSVLGAMNPTSTTGRLGQPTFGGNTQNFDSVTAPALPGAWNNVQLSGTGINWVTTTSAPSSAPNAAFANDPGAINDAALTTSAKITSATAQLAFKNKWTTENTFDGAVIEYSTNAGTTWTDFCPNCSSICPGANCPFVSGGYTQTISSSFQSPIAGRRAWSGTQGSFIDTVIKVPAELNGQNILVRWRMASDESVSSTGITIDDVVLTGGQLVTGFACEVTGGGGNTTAPFDFDGDHKTDIGITRHNGGNTEWWWSNSSNNSIIATVFGNDTDIPAAADFTGDGKADATVFRPSTGEWFVLRSEDFTFLAFPFGQTGDIPMPADYDGDSKADAAVYRPSAGTWFISQSGGGGTIFAQFGVNGDKPVAADYDGDGKADIAIVRDNGGNKEWWMQRSQAGFLATVFGVTGDKAVQGDYTGDGKADIAVWRSSTGEWFILRSEDFTYLAFPFGQAGDIPVPGDYDADGKFDSAVFRPSQSTWFINRTGGSGVLIAGFGVSSDSPIPNQFVR
jgi:hypothetical protein